jgi:hypothetical protein
MANILAAANGNWSSTATWTGGVLPGSSDFVYANGRSVTIDQNVTVARLSTRGENGAVVGGGFTCTTTAGVVRTITSTIIEAGTTTCLTFNHAALNTAAYINFSGGTYGTNANNNLTHGIVLTQSVINTVYTAGTCYGITGFNSAGMGVAGVTGSVHYHTGNLYGAAISTQSVGIIFQAGVTPAHTVYITGDLYGGVGGNGAALYTPISGTSTIYITGNIYGGNSVNAPGLLVQNSFTYVITGNAYGSDIYNGPAISVTYAGGSPIVTLIGTAIGGKGTTDSNGFFTQQAVTAYIKRAKGCDLGPSAFGATNINPGVYVASQSADVRVEEFEFGTRGAPPVRGFVKMTPGTNNVLVGRLSPTASKTLIDSTTMSAQLPATSNVRSGVSYNGGSSVGSCVIPSASSVANGVSVDSSVGTATLTQANVWGHVSPITSGSIGEKLKKTANTSDLIALG